MRRRKSTWELCRQNTQARKETQRKENLIALRQSTQKAPSSPFTNLETRHLEALAEKVELVTYRPGATDEQGNAVTVMKKGEDSTDLYIVVSGKAHVGITEEATRPLFPGSVFGEGVVS